MVTRRVCWDRLLLSMTRLVHRSAAPDFVPEQTRERNRIRRSPGSSAILSLPRSETAPGWNVHSTKEPQISFQRVPRLFRTSCILRVALRIFHTTDQ